MYNYGFLKSHTQIAKGVAIVLMMVHHLFAFPERIQNVSYISILPGTHLSVELIIGTFGKLCVSMYLFLTGYGLYVTTSTKGSFNFKDSFVRIFNFLHKYWIIFVLFVPIGLIWFNDTSRYKFEIMEFVQNLLVVSSSYNSEWWFAKLYIEMLILFPILKKFLDKNTPLSFLMPISLYIAYFFISVMYIYVPGIALNNKFAFIDDLNNILFWQMSLSMGYIIAKHNMFYKLNVFLHDRKLNRKGFYIIILFLTILIRTIIIKRTSSGTLDEIKIDITLIEFLFSPIFIWFSANLLYNTKFTNMFSILGKHSTNIWLIHTFFCYYYFQEIIFYPKLSLLILLWLTVLSLLSSILAEYICLKSKHMLKCFRI